MAARNGTGKLEGVHFVRRADGEAGSLTRTGARAKRKPMLAELEAKWAAVERAYEASCAIRKRSRLPYIEPTRFAHALYAELEARREAGDELATRRKAKAAKRPRKAPAQAKAGEASTDVFRMLKPDLIALGTPEALAELERRKAKRAAKREARMAA